MNLTCHDAIDSPSLLQETLGAVLSLWFFFRPLRSIARWRKNNKTARKKAQVGASMQLGCGAYLTRQPLTHSLCHNMLRGPTKLTASELAKLTPYQRNSPLVPQFGDAVDRQQFALDFLRAVDTDGDGTL